ncbi:MAG: poly-gamma-glutamate system protein [Bacilli bacterium]|nr:poly-gamma-glutamate system protein [Bacilli bacterium]
MKQLKLKVLIVWFSIIILLVVFSFSFKTRTRVNEEMNQKMVEASNLALTAFESIKELKIQKGIGISEEDVLNTGMIGSNKRTAITTTEGVLEAKRTSCNPEWAGVIVRRLMENGLEENDEVILIFSGSFPALNIAAMAACEVLNLKTIIFASIGASYYGANQEDFTFFDMAKHLNDSNILNKKIDYVSLGGALDIGFDFHNDTIKNEIINRINEACVNFIYEENYRLNIDNRLNIIYNEVPNVKMVINTGGSLIAYGQGLYAYTKTGFFEGALYKRTLNYIINNRPDNMGLLECLHLLGVDVFSMRDIRYLSSLYGIEYDPIKMPKIASSAAFYVDKYNIIYPIIGIVVSILFSVILFLDYKKYFKKYYKKY